MSKSPIVLGANIRPQTPMCIYCKSFGSVARCHGFVVNKTIFLEWLVYLSSLTPQSGALARQPGGAGRGAPASLAACPNEPSWNWERWRAKPLCQGCKELIIRLLIEPDVNLRRLSPRAVHCVLLRERPESISSSQTSNSSMGSGLVLLQASTGMY